MIIGFLVIKSYSSGGAKEPISSTFKVNNFIDNDPGYIANNKVCLYVFSKNIVTVVSC